MWKKMQLSSNCSRTIATRFSSLSRACIDNHTQQCLRLRMESHSWSIGTRTGLTIGFRSVHHHNNTSSKFLYSYSLTIIWHYSTSTCEHAGGLFSSMLWGSNKDLAGLKAVELSSPSLNALWPSDGVVDLIFIISVWSWILISFLPPHLGGIWGGDRRARWSSLCRLCLGLFLQVLRGR